MYTNLLFYICSALNRHQIAYMLTGSVAMNMYLVPRSTLDIDIEVMPEQIAVFLSLFDSDFYINHETVKAELQHRGVGMFNVIDHNTNYKIDFIVRKNTKYETEEFNNRRTLSLAGMNVTVCSPEDLIISKLQWIQILQSERQMNDIRNLLQLKDIDMQYIKNWISKLNLTTFNIV